MRCCSPDAAIAQRSPLSRCSMHAAPTPKKARRDTNTLREQRVRTAADAMLLSSAAIVQRSPAPTFLACMRHRRTALNDKHALVLSGAKIRLLALWVVRVKVRCAAYARRAMCRCAVNNRGRRTSLSASESGRVLYKAKRDAGRELRGVGLERYIWG